MTLFGWVVIVFLTINNAILKRPIIYRKMKKLLFFDFGRRERSELLY
jgi:hypothetical protein